MDSLLLIVIVYLLSQNSQHQLGKELYDATHDGNVEQVTQLLEEEAPVNWSNSLGWSSLHVACQHNKAEVLKVLLRYSPLLNRTSLGGYTPQHLACYGGSLDCLKLLLATGQYDLG